MTRCYLGIDPGLTGAVAMLDPYGATVWDTPTLLVGTKAGKRRTEYVMPGMIAILSIAGRDQGSPMLAVIEAVSARPGQGVVSSGRTLYGAGVWHALLTALGIPYRIVQPAVWKRGQGLLGTDKAASLAMARQRFPACADSLRRAKDHGRAEALLIADYGRQQAW